MSGPCGSIFPAWARTAVVHSLAKWKRLALKNATSAPAECLTDMNAIRRDETPDNLHSIYVDQWDWEKIIRREDRTLEFLKHTAQDVGRDLRYVEQQAANFRRFVHLSRDMVAVRRRSSRTCIPTICIPARSAKTPVPARAQDGADHADRRQSRSESRTTAARPDYDDWALNGDILFWNERLQRAFEISTWACAWTGIAGAAIKARRLQERRELPFPRDAARGRAPLTVGGGIGQSRLCMLMIGCAHIGEVQCSLWDEETIEKAQSGGHSAAVRARGSATRRLLRAF